MDVMMGGVKDSECSYTEFAANLQEDLESAYRDVRENLKVAQRRQKDAYDKGVKHTVYQPGDLVLRYTPQLRPGEASKFHRQWDGPFEIVSQVTEVTYCVRKVAGRSRRSKVVHFNNLRLYQRKQEKAVGEVVTGGLGTAPAVETVEEGHAQSMPGEEDGTVVGVAMSAVEEESELLEGDPELSSQQPDTPEISGCQSDDVQPSGAERDVRSDPSVEAPDTKDGGPLVDTLDATSKPTQSDPPDLSGEEEGSEHEGEGLEPEPTLQNRRPVRVRRPPDRYGEWVISSLQQIVDRVQMLEDKQTMEKDRIKKLRPKLLKKARALRGY